MIGRRALVAGLVGAPSLLRHGLAGAISPDRLFTMGVASGEPTSDGMVLWTRLAPRPLQGDGGMTGRPVPLRWEIFADEALRWPVRAGMTTSDPTLGHSVHLEVAGLKADRPYWYRFIAGGEASPVGRTRTAPLPGDMPDRLRFCFGSCQKYEDGYYGAWANVVADNPDLIFFLGDYIYEANPSVGTPRVHLNPEPTDVAGYRVRYATYRLDPQLQAAHAIAPWLVTWDDHEVANDYAGLLDQRNDDPVFFAQRRAAAYQVYYEFMPLRREARPVGAAIRLYRTLDWGRLAQFQIIDDRQYRSARACYPPAILKEHREGPSVVADCPELHDPRRTILGWDQERWLYDAFGRTRARWNVLTQQTQMTAYPRRDPEHPDDPRRFHTVDTWQGYPASRDRIVARWQQAKVPNPLVIGGDIHAFVASEIRAGDVPVAPCLVGGSITTRAGDKLLQANTAESAAYMFANNDVRGYGRVDLSAERADAVFRAISEPKNPASVAYDLSRFTVENGRSTLLQS